MLKPLIIRSLLLIIPLGGLALLLSYVRLERNRFESSYATRLNRGAGLYFGWRP